MVIPVAVRHGLAERLERHRRESFPELEPLVVRFSGDLAYVTRQLGAGETERMFRLSWKGSQDDWGFAVWSEPEQRYVYLSNGDVAGTPEDALDRAHQARPGRPGKVSTVKRRWSLPAPIQPGTHVLRPYVRAVHAHPLFVVLFVLGAVLGSVAIVLLRSPTYTARATLLVTPVERGEAGDLGLPLLQEHGEPTRTIQTAAAVIENYEIAAAAAADLGGRWTAEVVLDAIDVTPQGQTNVLEVRATAEHADTAAALANAYASSVIQVRGDALRQGADAAIAAIVADLAVSDAMSSSTVRALETRLSQLELMRVTGDPTVAVAELAQLPASREGPPAVLVVAAALVVGLVLAPGAALIVERLGPRRLMSEEEITEVYPLAVLARVPARRRRPTPQVTDQGRPDSFQRLRALIELAEPRPGTIMITRPSEGDGRTATALQLAAELAADGTTRVVLIDLDITRPVVPEAESATVEEAGHLAGFSRYRLPARRSLIVLGGRHLAEERSPALFVDAALEAIRLSADVADYVVLDAPPLDEMVDALRLAATADALILVVRLGFTTQDSVEAARTQLASTGIPATGYIVIGPSR